MTFDLALFGLALLLGLAAAIIGRPRPPALDPERLLKLCQSALIWGETEAAQGSTEDWTKAVARGVFYHPAGRLGWAKLADPQDLELPVPALPTERALLEDLARLEPGRARFRRLLSDDAARSALLDDPRQLGPDFEPSRWLAPDCDWEALAGWAPPVAAALARRLQDHHLVVVAASDQRRQASQLERALAQQVSSCQVDLAETSPTDQATEALTGELLAILEQASERLLLVVLGDAGPLALAALAASEILRDRVMLVLFVGCPLAGVDHQAPAGLDPDSRRAWLADAFQQEALDTEIRRSTPYCFLARLDPSASPPGDERTSWEHQRLAEPEVPRSGRRPIATVDLGGMPADEQALAPSVFARSLLLLAVFLLAE